jgi:hypothetical protein
MGEFTFSSFFLLGFLKINCTVVIKKPIYFRIVELISVLSIVVAAWFSKWWFLGNYAKQT